VIEKLGERIRHVSRLWRRLRGALRMRTIRGFLAFARHPRLLLLQPYGLPFPHRVGVCRLECSLRQSQGTVQAVDLNGNVLLEENLCDCQLISRPLFRISGIDAFESVRLAQSLPQFARSERA